MSDWFPQIVIIEKVEKHPFADSLDIVTVLNDYPIISKLGEYKVGDMAGYIPIDSIVQDTDQFYFLCPKAYEKYEEDGEIKQRQIGPKYPQGSVPEKYRVIKAKKIRNIYSQGMLVPAPNGLNVGDSIVDALGLKKWEEEVDDNVTLKKGKGTNAEAPPKGWSIPYYDIDGLRKYLKCVGEDEEIVLTEKLNGCLKHDTRIMLYSGAVKPISQIKIGDTVTGMANGKVVPSKVINKYNNGRGENWLHIEATRKNCGRGGNKSAVICTDEHRFFNPKTKQYIRAKNLNVGDKILLLRSDYGLNPIQENEFKPAFVEQTITKITKLEHVKSYKYDLETETHNYIANGIVVHNSNASYCYDGEKLWSKSRNYYKKFDPDDMWIDIAIRYDLENKLSKYPNYVFFGEIVGQVKKFRYDAEIVDGSLHTKIYFFDVYDVKSGRYLDYDDRVAMIKEAGLDPTPELYRGKWLGKDEMYKFAEGMTTLGGKHIREGFVLNTIKERFEPKLNSRMQVKLVGEGYNLSK